MAEGTPVDLYGDGNAPIEPTGMSADEILGFVKENVTACESDSSDLAKDRERLMNAYYGRGYGDETQGFSQVVSRDVMETTEWMTAQLLRIFSGERFCEFEPFGPDDVKAAEQQSDFVNYVIMQENEGTLLFHDWFKDALLLRNGIVHWGYETRDNVTVETYTGIDEQGLADIMADEGTELLSQTQTVETLMTLQMVPGPPGPDGQPTPPTEQMVPTPVTMIDCTVRRTEQTKKLRVICIPGEEFLIERDARSITDAMFCGHKSKVRRTDLVSMGVPKDRVDSLGGFKDAPFNRGESFARDVNRDSQQNSNTSSTTQEIGWLYTLYVRLDVDGDGIAERLRIRYFNEEIIDIEDALEAPYADLCPVRTPHRFTGLGYGDLVEDVQRIKTVLWRSALDNAYLSVRPQKEVVEHDVNLDDLAEATIGGNIRVRKAGSINPMVVPPMMEHALSMIEHTDTVREDRTGLSAAAMGRDADQMHDTAKGQAQQVSQSQMRVELVARLFADTGVKRLFVGLYNCIVRNQDAPRMVRLRDNFVRIDPREWRERSNVIVNVGLGVGTREAQITMLQMIATMQQGLMKEGIPLATPQNLEASLRKMIETAGFKNTSMFITAPEKMPPPPPPPVPESIQIAKIQSEIEDKKRAAEQAKTQAELQYRMQCEQMKMQQAMAELRSKDMQAQRDHELAMAQLGVKRSAEAEQREQQNTQFYDKLMQDAILAREKMGAETEKARAEAEADERAMKAALGQDETAETGETA